MKIRLFLLTLSTGALPWVAQADIFTETPVADASTYSDLPQVNAGSQNALGLRQSALNGTTWAYLRFDLQSSIPVGSTVTSAELQLYLDNFAGQAPFPVQLFSVNQAWSETGITWANRPPPDTLFSTTSIPAATGWVTWNATTLVQQWVSGARTNQGMALVPGGTNEMYLGLWSRESTTNQPRLVVAFTPPQVPPTITTQPQSQTVTEGDPVNFSVTATGTAPLSFQWRRDGAAIAGGTNSVYSIASAQTNHAGTYSVLVFNPLGQTLSSNAFLTVKLLSCPTILCPSNVVTECQGSGGAVVGFNAQAGNLCNPNDIALTITPPPGSFFPVGITTVNCTNRSLLTGRYVWCSFTVTVRDTSPPVLTCGTNKTVECGNAWSFDPPSAFDACCGTNVTISILGTLTNGSACSFAATRTWLATDCWNNSATCSQTVTVRDTTPPVITCASNKTIECGSAWTFDPPSAFDACCSINVTISIVNTLTNGTGCNLIITRTWQATDCCTNSATCSQTVTVRDTSPPVITCATNKTVECGTTWSFDPPSAFDACCGTSLNITIAGTTTNVGPCISTYMRTWRATDCCSNSATCTQTITVRDTTPPVITCAANKTVECGSAWTFDSPSALDACCGTNATTTVFGTTTNVGPCPSTYTRTWLATDCCTNTATCSQTVTVRDTTPPVITCASNKTVECGNPWGFDPPGAFDACCGTNVTTTVFGTVTNVGPCLSTYTRTWLATDCCTNTATCSQTVTVRDTTPPVIVCPSNIITNCSGSNGTIVFFSASATDNCDSPTLTCVPPSGSLFPPGDTLVRCVATDACGNSNVCSFTITVTNCLSCDPSLTRHDPDAPPGRALIKGRIQFRNSKPEILARLNVDTPSDLLQLQLNAVSATTRTYTPFARPVGPPSMDYRLVVEAEPAEAQPGSVFDVGGRMLLPKEYWFARKTAPPLHVGDSATVNFCECAALLYLRFVASPGGPPVSIAGGQLFITPSGWRSEWGPYGQAAADGGVNGSEYGMVVLPADSYSLWISYTTGTDPELDQVHHEYTIPIPGSLGCDEVRTQEIVLPEGTATGHVIGRVNMAAPDGSEGPVEVRGGDPRVRYGRLTSVVADAPNYVGDAYGDALRAFLPIYDRYDWLNCVPPPYPDPPALCPAGFISSGPFDLPKLRPSSEVGDYRFWARMQFDTAHGREYFRTPSLTSDPIVSATGTKDLGDALVLRNGHVSGRVFLQGPAETGGYHSPLQRLEFNPYRDSSWVLTLYSCVQARGVGRLAAGATETALDGWAVTEFDGALNASGAYDGHYELVLGGLKGQPSVWNPSQLDLLFDSSLHTDEPLFLGKLDIVDTNSAEVTVLPGSDLPRDFAYCFSEVVVVIPAPDGGTFFDPGVTVKGGFSGRDFLGNNAGYTVATGSAMYFGTGLPLPFLGTPTASDPEGTRGTVRLFLPQGEYYLTPQYRTRGPDGKTNTIYLPPLPGPVIVGCGQPPICVGDCCIQVTCPSNIVTYACGTNCAPVYYAVSATNRCDPAVLTVTTDVPSGTCFPLGTNWVHVTASGSGQANSCSFSVTVLPDPSCTNGCSTNLLVNGSFEQPGVPDGYLALPGGNSAVAGWVTTFNGVEYYNPVVAPLAVNTGFAADGNYLLDLAPASGVGGGIQQTFATVPGRVYRVSFALGTSKERGRNGTASLRATVPGVITYEGGLSTASPSIVWERREFSFFAESTSATLAFASLDDPALSFVNLDDVRVSNCPPPDCLSIICPTNLTVPCQSPTGAVVFFSATVTNRCSPTNYSVVCVPPSGSLFPIGTTVVTCTDSNLVTGEIARCQFTVTVSSNCPPATLPPPVLSASPLPGCRLQLCWYDPGSNYVLQSTASLVPPVAWQNLDVPVSAFNGQSCAILSNVCQGKLFLRLALGRLPVFSVLGPAVTPAQFAALNAQLNLPSTAYDTNGAVLFTDTNYFMRLPTEMLGDPGTRDEEGVPLVAERLLFDQINQIQVVGDQTALQQVQQWFASAGLMPTGIVVALPEVVHAQFSAVASNGTPVCDLPIDTKVRYPVRVGGIPIIGPGAKASVTFGENGIVTHINYSLRQITAGPTIPIPPPHVAYQTALSAYQAAFGQQPGTFSLTSEMVYYAPPAEFMAVQTLFPHFQFGGTFTPADGSNVIQLRTILLPAVTDSNAVPRVQLVVGSQGNSISAQAVVNGGLAPYRYRWGSCTTVLTAPDSPSISYQATGRSGVETLVLVVTDANGLSATASANIALTGGAQGNLVGSGHVTKDAPTIDVGTEWIGVTAGLDRAPANAAGFASRFGAADATVRFNWGEGNAFERDFKDALFGGDDNSWVDNVDAVFYTGHANGDGWVFTSSVDDTFLRYSEARYGQRDLEWLVIAACGPLQVGPPANPWWQRWGPAFQGLHLLCGYDNNSGDTTDEGRKWADYMLRNVPVAEAWTRAGIETQSGGGLRVAVMGVYGAGGLSNRGDHFWGRGSVGPDIRTVAGYWLTLTPVD